MNAGISYKNDLLDGTTKIIDKAGLEIEFLIGKKGSGEDDTMKTNMGITAQAFRHMDIISNNTIQIEYLGSEINVPKPEAYAIHKMVINKDRKDKQEKDIQAVLNIYPFLDMDIFDQICDKLNKNEIKRVNSFIETYISHH